MENNVKLDQLKSLIKIELDMCNPDENPWVCKMKDIDYSKVEKLIINEVANRGHSVNTAITDIERTYNLDYSND